MVDEETDREAEVPFFAMKSSYEQGQVTHGCHGLIRA